MAGNRVTERATEEESDGFYRAWPFIDGLPAQGGSGDLPTHSRAEYFIKQKREQHVPGVCSSPCAPCYSPEDLVPSGLESHIP